MFSPRQEEIINILRECPYTFSGQLVARLNISRERLRQLLIPLIKNKIVLREGRARLTCFRLAPEKLRTIDFLEKENAVLRVRLAELERVLDDRKVIERAKEILMAEFNIRPTEAYRKIQEESMRSRKSMREVAEAIWLPYESVA